MVLGLARYAMRSPLHTGILAALFAAVPMLYVVSAALVALTTLRHGLSQGTRVLALALIGGLVSWQITGLPLFFVVLVLSTLLGAVLRTTQSWSRTLLAGAVLGLVFAIVVQAQFGPQFSALIDSVWPLFSVNVADDVEQRLLAAIKSVVGYLAMSSQLFETILALLLARYWQAGLYNPGGLKAEMHALRFTVQEVVLLSLAVLLAMFIQPAALMLFSIPMIVVGMATVHGIVAKLTLGGQWLVALYIALIMFLQIIVPLLIVLVLVDSFFDLRSRIRPDSESDNE
ncbi:DUF2232 domain-containing protein [Reinekea blandensis]|nr:DUF2232 domain-containing protein [Reinekea blandensis]